MKINSIIPLAFLPMFALGTQVNAQSEPPTVSITVNPDQAARASVFWTDKRISEAKPFPMPIDYGPSDINRDARMEEAMEDMGEPGKTSPGRAEANSSLDSGVFFERGVFPSSGDESGDDGPEITDEYVSDILADGDLEITFKNSLLDSTTDMQTGTSQVYTSYSVNNKTALWKVYPHKWVGRLSFTTPDGTAYCSATAISGNNIVTAAHCIYDSTNNRWYSNWVFSPAYRAGISPYGTFTASVCWVLTNWVNLSGSYSINGWAKYDVAVCEMNNNSSGQTLNAAVGWAGRSWNYGYNQLHFVNGYPWRNTSNVLLSSAGYYLRSCTAESFQQTTDTLGSGCNYGPGISGGSWLRNYRALESSGNVNSVCSGMYLGVTNSYGPRFNSNNIVPLCNSAGC